MKTKSENNLMWLKVMVKGYTWKMRTVTGAVFLYWTPSGEVKRKEAIQNLFKIANAMAPGCYSIEDVERVWRLKGKAQCEYTRSN
jgi:hypothetical protein